MLQSPADIKARFFSEQDYVLRYVEFLHSATTVSDSDIVEISNILQRHRLPSIPRRQDWSRWREPYSPAELTSLLDCLRKILPTVDEKIAEYEHRLAQLIEPAGLRQVDVRSDLGEWIEFMTDALVYDSSPEAVQAARQEALRHAEQIAHEVGDEEERTSPAEIDYAIQSALFLVARERLDERRYVRQRYADLDLAARMNRPEAEINVLRQGFILLLTAFDAAVFDLVRSAFNRNFFGLIGTFGRQEKVSLETLARYGSFDALRDEIIEEQLKARYLKDLLFLLNDAGVQCVDEAPGERFIELVELVMRRNVHVHNRGVVDERYLERDRQGTPRFNIYNLTLGSIAEIDEPYWNRANKLCCHCVERIAAWADTQISASTFAP